MVENEGLVRSGGSLFSRGRDADSPGCEMKLSVECDQQVMSKRWFKPPTLVRNRTVTEQYKHATGRGGRHRESAPHLSFGRPGTPLRRRIRDIATGN
jgi:hypothetical protein